MDKKVLIFIIIWLVLVNVFALISLNRFKLLPDTAYSWINPNEFYQNKNLSLINLHCEWDCKWYLDIAQNGYQYEEGKLSNIVFFPVYPLLIKIISLFTLQNFQLAGWLISMVSLFLGAAYFYKLVKKFHPQIDPRLPILFMLIFPTAFFFNAVYTESLFLFLSVACFYYTLEKKYLLASIFGAVAALTRFSGFLLFFPIIFEYLQSQNFKPKFSFSLLSILLVPIGALLFPLYHYLVFGDFFLFFKVENTWGRNFNINYEHFQLNTPSSITNLFIDTSYVLFSLLIIFFVFKKLRASYGIYMIGTVLIALSTGTLMSIGRYILPLFPIYILFASVKNEYIKFAISLASVLFLALTIILFVNNYWAG